MINKKIASELAVGVILLLAVAVGGIFWMGNKEDIELREADQIVNRDQFSTMNYEYPDTSTEIQFEPAMTNVLGLDTYEEVEWRDKSKIIKDIKLFSNEEDNSTYSISEIGTIKSGIFAEGKILMAMLESDGPGGPGIFRFVQKSDDKQLYLLKYYSSDNFFDYYGSPTASNSLGMLNVEVFHGLNYANIKIASLEFPETIAAPNGTLLKKENDYPVGRYIEYTDKSKTEMIETYDTALDTDLLKFVYNDPFYGNVYRTDYKKITDENEESIYFENGFYIEAPGESFKVYSSVIDLGGDIPQINWNDGMINNFSYSYRGESGCGTSAYADVMYDLNDDDLEAIGKTKKGDVIYGFVDKNKKMLRDYYKADRDLAESDEFFFSNKKFNKDMSYEEFLDLRPIFFWKDSFGRIIRFLNYEVTPLNDGCGKPVIYLYPEQTQNISVKVTPTAGMSVSDPAYNGGWNVIADTSSNIKNLEDGKIYPYLFWEGTGRDIYHMPNKGFVIEKEKLRSFLEEVLGKQGLIEKEIDDFNEFWIPKMLEENKPYYFVTFVDRATIDKLAPLDIIPKPDSVIRILMDYRGLDNYIDVKGFKIKKPQRKGFTVVEWGGILK